MSKFHKEYYLENNPAAKNSGKTAFEHFVTEGWKLGLWANAEGDSLNGDDLITEAGALSGEELLSLIAKMSADNMREVDADSNVLDVPAVITTNFDIFKNMKASEAAKLVEDTPESLAIMERDDFVFLESSQTFDVGQTMGALDGSTAANILKDMSSDALRFLDAEGAYNLGAKLTAMSDESLAVVMAGLEVDSMSFIDSMEDFDMSAKLAAMDDVYLAKSIADWSENHVDTFKSFNDFNLADRLGQMDSSIRGNVLSNWSTGSLKTMDEASDVFKISDVVFGNMDYFMSMDADDMIDLLRSMKIEEIKIAAGNMKGKHLQFLDSANSFDLGATMGAIDDSLFAELAGGWDQSGLSYLKGLSTESEHTFDLESRLSSLKEDDLIKVLDNEGAWSFLDEMESFDLDDKLEGLQEESYTKILGGLDEGSFDFLHKKKGFKLGTKLGSLNEDNLTDVLKNLDKASYEFLGEMEDFDLDSKLESLDDDFLTDLLTSDDMKTFLTKKPMLSNSLTNKIDSALTYLDNNKSPEIKQENLDQTFIKSPNQSEYSYDASKTFIDTTDDKLTYSAQLVGANDTKTSLPDGWEINPESGVLTGKPETDDDFKIEVTAKDKGGMTVSDIFSVNVILLTNKPFGFTSEAISAKQASEEVYGQDRTKGSSETLIKLTLNVDMAGIKNEDLSDIESVAGAELGLNIDWTKFESIGVLTGDSSEMFQSKKLADGSVFVSTSAQLNNSQLLEGVTVSSLRTDDPKLTLVDKVTPVNAWEVDLASNMDLLTIYLNPVDDFEQSTLSYSGLIEVNQGAREIQQYSSSLDLFF